MLQHYSKIIPNNNLQKPRIEAGPNCESVHQHGVDQLRVRREERHLRRTKKLGCPSSGTYLVQSKFDDDALVCCQYPSKLPLNYQYYKLNFGNLV